MEIPTQPASERPSAFDAPSGLRVEFDAIGSPRRISHGGIMVNLFPGSGAEAAPANIYLRKSGENGGFVPLLGPGSPASYSREDGCFTARGSWQHLDFCVTLRLAAGLPAWFWHVKITNNGTGTVSCDLVMAQDTALAGEAAVRMNEYYVSQYIDHTPLEHATHGTVVASRQNQAQDGHHPWLLCGSLGRGVSFSTDALQFYGLAARDGHTAPALCDGLACRRLQHEHSMVAIQDEPFTLAAGARTSRGFFALLVPDHPAATSPADMERVDEVLAQPEVAAPPQVRAASPAPPAPALFTSAPLLPVRDLEEADIGRFFGAEKRQAETDREGRLLSFFTPEGNHVVLAAKERQVLRPHGLIMRTGQALVPEESAMTSTAWMNGVFHSMVTQGHVSINRLLSACHGYLGFFRSNGLHVFAEVGGSWQLLGIPSAFKMAPESCRWIYSHAQGVIEVTAAAATEKHELSLGIRVAEGAPARFLVSCHLAINGEGFDTPPPRITREPGGIRVIANPQSEVGRRFPGRGFRLAAPDTTVIETIGRDEMLFADGHSRELPFLCLITAPCLSADFTIDANLVESHGQMAPDLAASASESWSVLSPDAENVSRLAAFYPWLEQNALVHYLAPRGLEQYSGGGWGTRDVCQGPVELLLAMGRPEPIRDILLRVFRQQNPDGDWPQWFMFFDRERNIRPGDSHGDIVFWPLLALAQYLEASGDAALWNESVPFFHPDSPDAGERATILAHVGRALALIKRRVIPGTNLPAYGHGDWNDSLQPVDPEMRDRLCSAWTATLAYQTFVALARAMRHTGQQARAAVLETDAAAVLADFGKFLVADGVIAGLAYFPDGQAPELLIHPRDRKTGLSYSLLPMVHAIINDMLPPAEASAHLEIIARHLHGPDGARLFDRPVAYHGGPATLFQRAETASFFGREIGLMYTHAHLRYCEALAHHGDATAFFAELCRMNPVGMRDLVASATPRQSNCYYSSSDAAFADRYAASADYGKISAGEVALDGGWRVYSSGAGIAARLIMQCFLGLRPGAGSLVLDPVMDSALGQLDILLHLLGHPARVHYRMGAHGFGPVVIRLNGNDLPFAREPNRYRTGGARIQLAEITPHLRETDSLLEISLG